VALGSVAWRESAPVLEAEHGVAHTAKSEVGRHIREQLGGQPPPTLPRHTLYDKHVRAARSRERRWSAAAPAVSQHAQERQRRAWLRWLDDGGIGPQQRTRRDEPFGWDARPLQDGRRVAELRKQ
jgi:hypothetical protein